MATAHCRHPGAEDSVSAASASAGTVESPVRAEALAAHQARASAPGFVQESCPEAQPDLFAVLPAEPLGSVLASWSPELVPVPVACLGRPARASGAALTVVLVPRRRWFQRTQGMPERPA